MGGVGEVPSGPARLDVVRPARSPLGGGAAGWMRALIACGLAVALCLVGVDLARHPVLLHDAAAPLYLALLAVIAPAYVAASLLAARTAPGLGAVAGGVVTVLWVIELWAGNLGGREPLVLLAYRASIAGVLLATFVGGLLGALRHGG